MFQSRARWESARSSAQHAKDAAAELFVALDDAQTMTSALVEAYAGAVGGADGERLRAELAPALRAADDASHAWIAALDHHGDRLHDDDAKITELDAARRAFEQAHEGLGRAKTGLAAFRSRHPDLEERLEAVVARVRPVMATATQALEQARAAVAAAHEAGIATPELDRRLVEAERLGTLVREGPQRHGADAVRRGAEKLTEAAGEIAETAQRLHDLKGSTDARLRSTRTRLEGVVSRLEDVEPTLSLLRRRFSARCSDDLDHVPATADKAVAEARRLLERTAAEVAAERWLEAAETLEQARVHIGEAEEGVNAVVARRRDLEAVAADPSAEKDRVRFGIRDAQTLVVTAGSAAPSGEAAILDSLVARLETVDARLEGTHPDYWGYLTELRAIRDITAGVVRRTRAALAKRH